ncbi:CLUMA_CG011038, isoform A [Clunio marinus]|uniref:CLUMA_CG011038, isoform A n=1 Tax=Clunio marinus TaxID=568069 RepID=A0A1J1IBK5_9DIPT|nr:CLUMA_CG011038, isoform A [Clunio marinus]
MNKRKQQRLGNLISSPRSYDQDSEGFAFEDNNSDQIHFSNGEVSITINKAGVKSYSYRNPEVDEQLLFSPLYWHKVIISHKRHFNCLEVALPQIFRIVEDEFFAPVKYISSLHEDYFFVHNQGKALKKLFDQKLQINVKGETVDLVVRLCIGNFSEGMLTLNDKLSNIIQNSIDSDHNINLSRIHCRQELKDVIFSLTNEGCLAMLCEQLRQELKKKEHSVIKVSTLNLSENEISSLEPFSRLFFHLDAFDFQFNKISLIDEFQYLNHFKITQLNLLNNPVTQIPQFQMKIKTQIPTLKMIDSFQFESNSVQAIGSHIKTESQSSSSHNILCFDNRSDEIRSFKQNVNIINFKDINDYVKSIFPKEDNKLWNKIIVFHNGKVDKETILNAMNKQFFNLTTFYPCYYKRGEKADNFFLYKNYSALKILMENDLKMEIQEINETVKFEVHLGCADYVDGQVNWSKKINYVIKKRIRGSEMHFDNFSADSDLIDLEVTLTTSVGFSHILNTTKQICNKMCLEIESLNLQNNKIFRFNALNFIATSYSNLKILDLRNNNIESIEEIFELPNLTKIYLDSNPVCIQYYDNPFKYVTDLQRLFPNLESIDEKQIDSSTSIVNMQNFLITSKVYSLTEQFLNFFEYFDSYHEALREFYHKDSIFTISNESQVLNQFNDLSRNIIGATNINKVLLGPDYIINFFETFPPTTHDYTTMSIDVPLVNERNVLITTRGFFKTTGTSIKDSNFHGFTRSFLLSKRGSKSGTVDPSIKYRIMNEMLHIRDLSDEEKKIPFKKLVVSESEVNTLCKDLLPSAFQKEEAHILVFRKITHLKINICKRLLEDAKWDIKTALTYFDEFLKRNLLNLNDFDL